jgi:hypothetical protein
MLVQAIDALQNDALDCGWQLGFSALGGGLRQFCQIEWVAFGVRNHFHMVKGCALLRQFLCQSRTFFRRQRPQRNSMVVGAVRPTMLELLSRETAEDNGMAGNRVNELIEQSQRECIGPLQVVENYQ